MGRHKAGEPLVYGDAGSLWVRRLWGRIGASWGLGFYSIPLSFVVLVTAARGGAREYLSRRRAAMASYLLTMQLSCQSRNSPGGGGGTTI